MNKPPLRLIDYKNSVLRAKMAYVAALLRWASNWLAEVQDLSLEAAFEGLAHAKQVRRLASAVEKSFEEAAMAEMFHAEQPYYLGDGFTAVLRPGSDRKAWQHEKVMTALIEQHVEKMQDRFPYVPESTLRAVVTESMWEVHKAGRVEWRSTDLRRAGVDPDLYSKRTNEAPSIDMRGQATYVNPKRRPRGVRRAD